jgi:TonB family protein
MKIVCDTCGTRYSIEDRQVAGKSFKIRCKQCAHVIVLAGPRAPTAEPAAPGTWHAVIDGTPRPIALGELRQLRAAGALDDRSLVWREGFDDWRALGGVDELREVAPPSVDLAPDAGPEGRQPGEPGASAGAEDAAGRSLEPAPLRGVRHETSVLFSLGNLARLAAPVAAGAAPAAAGEGSGLLDIRSLARSLAPTRAERSSAVAGEVPVYGAVPFGEPAVLIPRPPGRDRRLIWALAATAGALTIVTLVLLVIVMRGGAAASAVTPPALAAMPGASGALPPASPGSAPAPASPAPIAHTGPAAAPARTAAESAGPDASPAVAHTEPTTASPERTERVASSGAHAEPTAPVSAAPAAPRAPGPHGHPADAASRRAPARAGAASPVTSRSADAAAPPAHPAEACSEITCIVNGYNDSCCAMYRQPAAGGAPAPRADLPDGLDRAAIASGLGRIDTRGCGQQSPAHGDVKVSVKVSPAGAVTDVTVKSSPDPALDACVTAAVRKGTFPATQRGGSFAYLWRF